MFHRRAEADDMIYAIIAVSIFFAALSMVFHKIK